MDFAQLLTELMTFLLANLISPIEMFLEYFGYDLGSLKDLILNFGFGGITWFSINAHDLLLIVIGLMVSITALVLTWKFLKFLNNLLKGLFTGIKR